MTFVGKLLVVIQLVLSICFMAFAGAVYTHQTSWKVKFEKTSAELEKEKTGFKSEKDAFESRITDLTDRAKKAEERAKKAEGDLIVVTQQRDSATEKVATLERDLNTQKNLAEASQSEANIRRDESRLLTQINDTLNKELNAKNAVVRAQEDELFNVKVENKSITEKYEAMLRNLAVFTKVLASNGFSTDPKSYGKVDAPTAQVFGRVVEVESKAKGGRELIQISIGSDDDVREGAVLDVYRVGERAKFLAKIKIELVKPDAAVGSVINGTKNGVIEKGDYVTTKL